MFFKIKYIFIFLTLSFSNAGIDQCVQFSINTDRDNYIAGENLFLNIDINIDDGFHIYSVHPEKSLSPSYIEFYDFLV